MINYNKRHELIRRLEQETSEKSEKDEDYMSIEYEGDEEEDEESPKKEMKRRGGRRLEERNYKYDLL